MSLLKAFFSSIYSPFPRQSMLMQHFILYIITYFTLSFIAFTDKQDNYGHKQEQRQRNFGGTLTEKCCPPTSEMNWKVTEVERYRNSVPHNQSCRNFSFCVNHMSIVWRNRKETSGWWTGKKKASMCASAWHTEVLFLFVALRGILSLFTVSLMLELYVELQTEEKGCY